MINLPFLTNKICHMKTSHEVMDSYFCGGNALGYLQRTDLWQKSLHQF